VQGNDLHRKDHVLNGALQSNSSVKSRHQSRYVKHHILVIISFAIGAIPGCDFSISERCFEVLTSIVCRAWLYLMHVKVLPIVNGLIGTSFLIFKP
jgi:hypothetical protein